jgi:hypothetical protein
VFTPAGRGEIPPGPKWRPLRKLSPAEFDACRDRVVAEMVAAGDLPHDWSIDADFMPKQHQPRVRVAMLRSLAETRSVSA